jgi:5-methylcytosine-specific restriction enzyme B
MRLSGIVEDTRIKILQAIKTRFGVVAAIPRSFAGIPILNNLNSWFFAYMPQRKPDDIERLWEIFVEALKPDPLKSPTFATAFDKALEVRNTNINLTIGLFWIRPRIFLNLDGTMRGYKKIKLPSVGISAKSYIPILEGVKAEHPDFAILSHEAYLAPKKPPVPPSSGAAPLPPTTIPKDIDYWMVGAYWEGEQPSDQTSRFLAEGIWENGYDNKFIDEVKAMKVGDKIAIKATTTQKLDLPFKNAGRTASVMMIKAIGTIVKNRADGKTIEVEWDQSLTEPKNWYFYTGWWTVWHLKKEDKYAQRLIQFVFYGVPQEYDLFIEELYGKSPQGAKVAGGIGGDARPYAVADLIDEGVFLTEEDIYLALRRLKAKKNLILQGAPGVGKTFVAKRLAYALMESADDTRVKVVQFHPSYSYEDFIRGYRPTDEAGKFELMDGSFWLRDTAQSGLEYRHHVHPLGTRVCVPGSGNRLVLAEGSGLEIVEHTR